MGAMTRLLDSKLSPPPLRPGLVDRPRVTAAVLEVDAPLVLIVAGPGYGKTVAAHQAALARGAAVAWVSLDAVDDAPGVFWAYVAEALRRATGAGDEAAEMIAEGAEPVSFLTALLDDLAGLATPVTLVLDDLHVVRSTEILATLGLCIDRLPPRVRIVATARTDPRLPVPRWRLDGRVVEIRQDVLRFAPDEADDLVRSLGDVRIGSDDLATLVDRTEGWPGGLGLSLLSLRGRDDGAELVRTAFPPDRMVADYLVSEVLDRLDGADRQLLLDLSIVDDFDGALAVHVSGRADAGDRLRSMEDDGVLVEPVDLGRTRLRFHQLLRDLLVEELRWRQPERVAKLHWRAAEHLALHGDRLRAVHQYVAGDHLGEAFALVSDMAMEAFDAGDVVGPQQWLALFPAEFVAADASRIVTYARVHLASGDVDGALGWLQRADRAEHAPVPPLDEEIAVMRAVIRAWQGDVQLGRELADAFLAGRRPLGFPPPVVNRLPANRARMAIVLGDLDDAERWLDVARTVGGGPVVSEVVPRTVAADLALCRGDLDDAEALARAALARAEQLGIERNNPLAEAHAALAQVHLARGELADAERSSITAIELFSRLGITILEVRQRVLGIRLATDRFGATAGRSLLDASRHALRDRHVGDAARALLVAAEAELCVVRGDVAGALPLIDALPPSREAALLRTRALLRMGRTAEVDAVCEEHGPLDSWPVPLRVERLVVAALAHRGEEGHELIRAAADLGVPRGYRRPYLAMGPEVLRLVRAAHRSGPTDALATLLATIEEPAPSTGPAGGYATTLTEREQALLRLLPTHMTYREIADELCVSINTVKTYQKALYRKLQVATRSDAVAAGRRAGLTGA